MKPRLFFLGILVVSGLGMAEEGILGQGTGSLKPAELSNVTYLIHPQVTRADLAGLKPVAGGKCVVPNKAFHQGEIVVDLA